MRNPCSLQLSLKIQLLLISEADAYAAARRLYNYCIGYFYVPCRDLNQNLNKGTIDNRHLLRAF